MQISTKYLQLGQSAGIGKLSAVQSSKLFVFGVLGFLESRILGFDSRIK